MTGLEKSDLKQFSFIQPLRLKEVLDLPAYFAIANTTHPGTDKLGISQEGNRTEAASGKIRTHRAQDHKEQCVIGNGDPQGRLQRGEGKKAT